MSIVVLPELPCCRPSAYDGASRTLVHGDTCEKKGQPLSVDEWASIRKATLKQAPDFERAAAQERHPVNYQTRKQRKVRLLHCRCSSPVMPCEIHKDAGEDWWE